MKPDKASSFKLDVHVVKQAYLYLKSYAYYENLNFFLKQKIAEFECDSFDENIRKLSRSLRRENFTTSSVFTKWLESIDCRVLPKSVSRSEDQNDHGRENGLFISNVTTSSEYYRVGRVNYFISAPVELHLIEVLWCLVVGPIMEEGLKECCYGNRLDDSAKNFIQEAGEAKLQNSRALFKYYVDQYGSWRDQALKAAEEISEKDEDVALLSLDFESYFYQVEIDFREIRERIEEALGDNDQLLDIALKLTGALEKIFSAYHERITPFLESTHPKCGDKKGLPIGLVSSAVLANWYLAEFDRDILEEVRPDYYGRYVDALLSQRFELIVL